MLANRNSHRRPRGLTLTELLVAIAIVALLAGVLITAGSTIQKNIRRTRAEQQLALLADAIEKYTQAWPAWKAFDGTVLADKGWPDWSASRLFATSNNNVLYPGGNFVLASDNFNQPNNAQELDLSDDDTGNANDVTDIEYALESMAYGLTAAVGSGPIMREPPQDLFAQHEDETYPVQFGATTGSARRFVFNDPWGNQLRYFWVARDPNTAANPSGWRAVTTANYTLVDGQGRPLWNNNPDTQAFYARANGFVLESAGPDGKFGFVWKPNPTPAQRADAADNITLKP